MQKIFQAPLAYGLLFIGMTASIYAAPAFAQDMAPPLAQQESRPPQIIPAENYMPLPAENHAAPNQVQDTPHVLGTISKGDMAAPAQQPVQNDTAAVSAPSSVEALQPKQFGEITYVTGGIGDEERSALKDMQKDYNLYVLSAGKGGQFVADTHILINNRKGDLVLDAVAGPMFYVKLPAGNYSIEATNEGQVKKQKVTVNKGNPAKVYFSW